MPFKNTKHWFNQFFHFNKQERRGVFLLCLLIFGLFGIKLLLPVLNKDPYTVQLITVSEPLLKSDKDENPLQNFSKRKYKRTSSLFAFNPNTVSEEGLQKLGFSKKLSATLIHYRHKGGRFFKPEDLKKLYGLSPQLYSQLESYILIPKHKDHKDSMFVRPMNHPYTVYEKKSIPRAALELNSADSLSLVYLKGIGPGFTKRILNYRNRLGGFHSLEQLKSVYGMTDSLFQIVVPQIMLNSASVVKIPVNSIDLSSLRKHPYITYQLAQAIINFRTKHGKLVEKDIIDLGILNNEKLNMLLPYFSY